MVGVHDYWCLKLVKASNIVLSGMKRGCVLASTYKLIDFSRLYFENVLPNCCCTLMWK